jgi:TRAP-type C4-dicarboxylate transport system permease small subunit
MQALSRTLDKLLATVTIALLLILAAVVVVAVVFRYSGASLIWYDEVAAILLAWLSYYGAALAALRRAHLGFGGLVKALPVSLRFIVFLLAEVIMIGVFAIVAWAGWSILEIFGDETLVSLPVPRSFVQSCVPIAAGLVILAQILSAPRAWSLLAAGVDADAAEIAHEIERAERSIRHDREISP